MDLYSSAAGGSTQQVSYNASPSSSSLSSTDWTIKDITQKMISFEMRCLNVSLDEAKKMNASLKNGQRSVKYRNLQYAIKVWCDCSQALKKKAPNTVQLYKHALNLTDEANIEFAIAKYC
jgi:hypothetical protein